MVGLRTFGGFDVDLSGAHSGVAGFRPRIMALLALLDGHGPRGLSRDKVLAYLWPESDTDHARNSLKQAVFSLPHASSGPHGFYVSGLAEFERWAELERERLAAAYRGALKTLAVRAEAEADWPAAIAWWRRLTQCDPYSTPAALGFMKALESSGDPTGAVEHAHRHAARLRTELDCPVAGEVLSLIQRLGTHWPVHQMKQRAVAVVPGAERWAVRERHRSETT